MAKKSKTQVKIEVKTEAPAAGRLAGKVPHFLDNMLHVAIASLVFGAIIGVVLTMVFLPPAQPVGQGPAGSVCETGTVSATDVAAKVEAFINANLLEAGFLALDAEAVPFNNSVYQINFKISDGSQEQVQTVFATVDGKNMFIGSENMTLFDLDVALPKPELPEPPAEVEVSSDDDPFLGPVDAEITIVEFSDFQCPYCAAAMDLHDGLVSQFKASDPSWEAAVPKLKELAKEGKIKFVFRDFPLGGHQFAQKAAEAAECAEEQGKFWEYHDMLFANYTALDVASLKQYAASLGLDSTAFDNCLDSGQMAAEVQSDFADGTAYGVTGTPAFFVNGTLVSGAASFSVFETVIEAELNK